MIVGVSYHAGDCKCRAFSQMVVGVSYHAGGCERLLGRVPYGLLVLVTPRLFVSGVMGQNSLRGVGVSQNPFL